MESSFKTRARIINQLGEQLIKNESIALLELIKNSYDADASECTVEMINPNIPEKGKIVILDDGEGMDYNVLSKAWLEIGTSYKEDLLENEDTSRSPKYGRLRQGEKGIGRLGVHRLGKEIEIITRKKQSNEYRLSINWEDIENSQYIEDIPINITETEPDHFKSSTGTKITIKNLRVPWTRKMVRDCSRSVTSLNSPFDSDDSFRVTYSVSDPSLLKGLMSFEDIEQYKLFEFDVSMEGNEIVDFSYQFVPWPTMKKLTPRNVDYEHLKTKKLQRMVYVKEREQKDIDLNDYQIGRVRFKGIIFDKDSRILSLGVQDKQGLKKYLNSNGGIRVFRDNMRVLDYGEPGIDWLDLDGRRINMPGKKIGNSIILAAVYLNREESKDLREKANREGFVENSAYFELVKSLRFAIDRIESFRNTDKSLLRKFYGPTEASQPVLTSITELKNVVDKKVKEESTKKEIRRYLTRIEDDYERITESLIKSSGAGLNLIVVMHQIEKIINDLKATLKSNFVDTVVEEKIEELSSLIEGYSILVKKSEKKMRSLNEILNQTIFSTSFRLKKHKIQLDLKYKLNEKEMFGLCSKDHVLHALLNIFDNSIWWFKYSETNKPEIFIDISDSLDGYTSIIIADNGPGFSLSTEEIILPFVTNKPDGMGIGLHLTHQIMESLGGKLLFPENDLFDIPPKYEKGAIIALAFKNRSK